LAISSGVFGQYFLSVLIQLELVVGQKDVTEIYTCTEKGRHISQTFEKNHLTFRN